LDENRGNPVLRVAEGFWYVQPIPSGTGKPEDNMSRIWFSANVVASRLLPTPVVDYAAERALRRATTWLHTHFERENIQDQLLVKRRDLERLKMKMETIEEAKKVNIDH
jgi:hypothetical protein